MSQAGRDERLLRYLEGTLSPSERLAVESELDQSPSARQLVAELTRIYGDGGDGSDGGDHASTLGDETEHDGPPSTRSARLNEGTTIGRYRIVSLIGAGSMGAVYRARDPALDREVALKLIHGRATDERSAERLLREARALAKLSHPNVVDAYDAGVHEGAVYLAMELVRGVTLRQWLDERSRSWQETVRVFLAAGRGLAAAHAAGLVHRDFKPANVLVRHDGQVLVTDFGLARGPFDLAESAGPSSAARHEAAQLESLTETGAIMGTPAYMSPEQITGRPVGPATDQFSFCVTMFEALFGERPFRGTTFIELSERITFAEVLPPLAVRSVPRPLWQAIARGLAKAPDDRWPSMQELVERLRACSGSPRRWPWVAGGTVVMAGLLGLGLSLREPARACPSDAALRARLWPDDRPAALRSAVIAAAGSSTERWDATLARLVANVDGWVAAYGRACRDGIDEDSFDARHTCLERWARRTDTLLDAVAGDDADRIDRAIAAIAELPPPDACLEEQPRGEPWPETLVDRQRVAQLRLALAEVMALEEGGRPRDAVSKATEVLGDAQALGYGPLEAEAQHALGRALETAGDPEQARAAYEASYWLAQAFGHDLLMAESATFLVGLLADDLSRVEDAKTWQRHAHAAVDRLGERGTDVAGALANHEGMLALRQRDAATAIDRFQLALATVEERLDHDSRSYAALQENLAMALTMDGRHEEALARLRLLLEQREALLGPEHPELGGLLAKIGGLYYYLDQPREALAYHRRALAIRERSLGPEHWRVATTRHNLGLALVRDGRLDEAAQEQEAAVRITRAVQGREHDNVIALTLALADTQLQRGQLPRVHELLDELEQTLRTITASRPELRLKLHGLRLRALARGGDLGGAREQLEQAHQVPHDTEEATAELARIEAMAAELGLLEPSPR
ncbi:MAG: serine/threonine-protein kinase [Nannocystaceae bacterium]